MPNRFPDIDETPRPTAPRRRRLPRWPLAERLMATWRAGKTQTTQGKPVDLSLLGIGLAVILAAGVGYLGLL